MAELQKISTQHEAIADYLLAFPERSKRECAEAMGVSPAWLSTVINSNAFRAYMTERRRDYNQVLHEEVVAKMYKVVGDSLDTLDRVVLNPETDPRLVLDIKDKTLEQLGYGSKSAAPAGGAGNSGGIHLHVNAESLQIARNAINMLPSRTANETKVLPGGETVESGDISNPAIVHNPADAS